MKIKRLSAKRFGCLKDWESPDIYGDIIVVHGDNESGKTTLFNLVSTVFYGWDPVSDNPHIPWDESFAECSAIISCSAGDSGNMDEAVISRKLRNKPDGAMYVKDIRYQLANRPIDQLSLMSRDIYNEVYMLSVDMLKFPEGNTWVTLQDQLLGGQYRSILKPLKEVVNGLDNEASSLWRPDKKGNAEDKRLKVLQGQLKDALREAEENEKALKELENEIEKTNANIQKYYTEKLEITKALERYEKLYPVYRKLNKIDELNESAGDISSCSHIPEDVESALEELNKKRNTLIAGREKAARDNKGLEDIKSSYTSTDEAVLRCRQDLESLVKSYGQVESDLNTLSDIEHDIGADKNRLAYKGSEVLTGGWNEELEDTLHSIDQAELRASIQACKAADAKYHEAEARMLALDTGRPRQSMPKFYMLLSILMMVFGAAGVIVSSAYQSTGSMYISALAALFGICLLIVYAVSKKGEYAKAMGGESEYLKDAADKKSSAKEQVKVSLKGLPAAAVNIDDIGEGLLLDVSNLKDLVYKINDNMEKKHKIIKRLKEKYRMLVMVLQACGIEPQSSGGETGSNMLKNILLLENALKEAEGRFNDYNAAVNKLDENNRLLIQLDNDINDIDRQIESILSGLEHMDGDDLHAKCESLKQRRNHQSMAIVLKEEMEHDYPDLDDITALIENLELQGVCWMLDDDKLFEVKSRCGMIDDELTKLNEELGYMKNELKQRKLRENPDDIMGRIQYIDIERKSAQIKRDRLMLLKNILIEGDRRFREENQPDVLHKAGQYISLITGGRYTKIYTDEGGDGLQVSSRYSEDILDVEKKMLSRGTREQIYLSIRLGLMDHLDKDGERLPMFLDEALVDWDSTRLKNTMSLLKNISQTRQVFIFTCSDNIYSLLEGDNIQYIELC